MFTTVLRNDSAGVARKLAATLEPLQGRTVLVTGASGFVGSFFVDTLAAFNRIDGVEPCRILAVDNFTVGLPLRLQHLQGDANFTFAQHDVSQPMTPDHAPDFIIHCAGIASPIIYRRLPLETIAVNFDGARHMLELARQSKTKSMLVFSSSEVYGDPDPAFVPTPESYRGNVSCTGPRSCYDESKRMLETVSVVYNQQFGTPVKIIRPFNVYGPGQRIDDGRIIPDLMRAAVAGGPLVLFSDGRPTRSFCYVADFVTACLLILMSNASGEEFNVGNDHEVSIGELAKLVAEVAATPPLKVEFRVNPDADYLKDNPNRRCPDLTKVKTMMNWAPAVPLRDGLARTLAHYRQERTPEVAQANG